MGDHSFCTRTKRGDFSSCPCLDCTPLFVWPPRRIMPLLCVLPWNALPFAPGVVIGFDAPYARGANDLGLALDRLSVAEAPCRRIHPLRVDGPVPEHPPVAGHTPPMNHKAFEVNASGRLIPFKRWSGTLHDIVKDGGEWMQARVNTS